MESKPFVNLFRLSMYKHNHRMKKLLFLLLFGTIGHLSNAQCPFTLVNNQTNQVQCIPLPVYVNPNFLIEWDFGDGTTIFGGNQTHTYAFPGMYFITQTITDSSSGVLVCSATQTATVNFCQLNFSQSTTDSLTYSFTGSAFGSNTLQWDFGDGSPIVTGTNVTHTYALAGQYTVNMYEMNGIISLCNSSVVIVAGQGGSCSFISSQPDPIASPNKFNFNAIVPNSSGTVSWNFGDNTGTYTGNLAQHVYANPGTYNVCMTFVDGIDTCIFCATVSPTASPGNCTFTLIPDTNSSTLYTFAGLPGDTSSTIVWYFGDGATAVGDTVVHQYANGGVYSVCMQETSSINGTILCSICYNLTVLPSPLCNFVYNLNSTNPQEYAFAPQTPLPSYTYVWDFSDTGTDSSMFPVHVFSAPGIYTVCLNIIQNGMLVCQSCQTVNVTTTSLCAASFTAVSAGLNTYFIDQSWVVDPTMPPTPAPVYYSWSFGDGDSSNLQFPQHTYSTPSTYNVCLTINSAGCTSTFCYSIYVDSTISNPSTCNSFFIFTQLSPYQLVAVNLSSGFNLNYLWDFGDGTTSTTPYPFHQYTSNGNYQICLTVSDGTGCTDTYCDTLVVDSLGNIVYRGLTAGFNLSVLSPSQLTSGIDEQTNIIGNLFPNPVSEVLNLQLSNAVNSDLNYRIYSIDGKVVQSGLLDLAYNKIQVNGLDEGLYLIEFVNGSGVKQTSKFMKQ